MSRCLGKRIAAHTWWLGTKHIYFPFFSCQRSYMIGRKIWKVGWFFFPTSGLLYFACKDHRRHDMRQGKSCCSFEASLPAPTCRLAWRLRFCVCHRFPWQVSVQALFCSRAECCYDYLRDVLKCHLLILSFWNPGWKCSLKGQGDCENTSEVLLHAGCDQTKTCACTVLHWALFSCRGANAECLRPHFPDTRKAGSLALSYK